VFNHFFFIAYLGMDVHVLLNQNTFVCVFFLNTCTKAEHKINAICECENFLFSVPLFHNMAIVHVISVNIVKLYFIIVII